VTGKVWNADEIRAFVAGRVLWGYDPVANRVWLPGWLRREAATSHSQAWLDLLRSVHPAERGTMARAGWEALRRPGEVLDIEGRVRKPDGWVLRRTRILNLSHQADVRCVLHVVVSETPIEGVVDGDETSLPMRSEAPPFIISYMDADAHIMRIDGMVEHFYGLPVEALIGEAGMKFLHPDCHDACVESWLAVHADPDAIRTINLCIERPDLTTIWCSCTIMNRLAGSDAAIVYVCHDITERLRQEAALRDSQEQFATLAAELPDAVVRADAEGRVEYSNARWSELVAPIGEVNALRDLVEHDARELIDETLRTLVRSTGASAGAATIEVRSADGDRSLQLSLRAVGDPGGGKRTVIGSVHDITATAELRQRAEYDPLTNALNRDSFERRLAEAMAEETDVLLVFVDLDNFKMVNDRFGHAAGDRVLIAVADRLQRAVRPTDQVARFGGDEFVILCHGAVPESESGICDRIGAMLSEPLELEGGRWVPTASLGTALASTDETIADVIARADGAMYQAKRARPGAPTGPE